MSLTHNYDAALRYAYQRLERSKIGDDDKWVIRDFAEHTAARGVSKMTLAAVIKRVCCPRRTSICGT